MTKLEPTTPISAREKIVITLTILLIKMIKPWEYDHQFKEFFEQIKKDMV